MYAFLYKITFFIFTACEFGEPYPNVYCRSSSQLVCAKSFYCKKVSPLDDNGVCCKGNVYSSIFN